MSSKKLNNSKLKVKNIVKDDSDTIEDENEAYIYTHKDKDDNIRLYVYHYKYKDNIYLRCKDRKCKGAGRLEKGKDIKIITECNLGYNHHSYVKYQNAYKKISNSDYDENDIKKYEFQKAFYEYQYECFPKLTYDDITMNLATNFPNLTILYSKQNFNYYKSKVNKKIITDSDIDRILSDIKFRGELLQKIFYKYINKDGNSIDIRIYGTEKTLKYLKDESINQYFIDGTYKILPKTDKIKSLVLLLGFNFSKNLYLLCSLITLGDET